MLCYTHIPNYTGNDILSSVFLSLAAYLSLYHVVLICPFLLMSYKVISTNSMYSTFMCMYVYNINS